MNLLKCSVDKIKATLELHYKKLMSKIKNVGITKLISEWKFLHQKYALLIENINIK